MTIEQYVTLVRWVSIYIAILLGGLLFYHYDTRPNKTTRKKLKRICRKENKMTHQIVNLAIEEFIKRYEETEAQEQQNKPCKRTHIIKPKRKPKQIKKWYPTGWTYNEKTKLWDPPDYLSEEAAKKWEWDEEKQIWIDQDKKRRMERYQQYRKEQGKEPTFEEWKTAQEQEQHPE